MSDWKLFSYASIPLAAGAAILTGLNGYRPFQWSLAGVSNDPNQLVYLHTNIAGYFFDAIFRVEHLSNLRITEHPVQDGANISDHAYKLPEHITLEIGMSDCMDSFISGQFGVGDGKSIQAYQVLKGMQEARNPLSVVTRLQVYNNMLIESIVAMDDVHTRFGGKFIVTLKQIITAQLATTTVKSDRPQTTQETPKAQVQAEQPGSAISEYLE